MVILPSIRYVIDSCCESRGRDQRNRSLVFACKQRCLPATLKQLMNCSLTHRLWKYTHTLNKPSRLVYLLVVLSNKLRTDYMVYPDREPKNTVLNLQNFWAINQRIGETTGVVRINELESEIVSEEEWVKQQPPTISKSDRNNKASRQEQNQERRNNQVSALLTIFRSLYAD